MESEACNRLMIIVGTEQVGGPFEKDFFILRTIHFQREWLVIFKWRENG
jgi:hypothetical protein